MPSVSKSADSNSAVYCASGLAHQYDDVRDLSTIHGDGDIGRIQPPRAAARRQFPARASRPPICAGGRSWIWPWHCPWFSSAGCVIGLTKRA